MNKQNCNCRIHRSQLSEKTRAYQVKNMFERIIRRNFDNIEIADWERAFGDGR